MRNAHTVALSKETKKKLESLGTKGETYDEIVARVIENTHGLCKPRPIEPISPHEEDEELTDEVLEQ